MPCKITTRWCNVKTKCKAEIIQDGDSFIDPPQSALSPSQGSALNPAPPPGYNPQTVEWTFQNGVWKHFYWAPMANTYFYGDDQEATRIQPTKLKLTCQKYVVCYKADGECPSGLPPSSTPPGLYDNSSSWESQAENSASGYGSSPTNSLPTLPIDLGIEQDVSEQNGDSVPGSIDAYAVTANGAIADCVTFAGAVEESCDPFGDPTVTNLDGPALQALN
jgi:hypothetical protein